MTPRSLTPAALCATGLVLAGACLSGLALQAQPATDAAALYKSKCALCHGPNGDSKVAGMSFTDGQWKHGTSVKEMSALIRDGVKGTAMLPFKGKLTDPEIEALAKYVRSFDKNLK